MIDRASATPSCVALTGAAGFIGSAIRPRLLAAGYAVRALHRPRAGRELPQTPGLTWIAGTLDDSRALAQLMHGCAAVVHCAGQVRGARRTDFDAVNVDGVLRAVEAAQREPTCRRFLLLSSLAAREPQLSDYARSKQLGERALERHAGSLAWTVLRPPAVYGPGDREMRPLLDGMARGLVPVPGRGSGRFSLIHVADLATAVLAWVAEGRAGTGTFTLDDGHPGGYDWDTLLTIAARVLRDGRPIRRLPIPLPVLRTVAAINLAAARAFGYAPMLSPGKVRELTHPDWVGDGDAFQRATGWHPAIDFADGLAETLGRTVVD